MKFPTEATLRRVIAFVAALGVGVATYIAIADSGGGAPACLAGGDGCETVAEQLLLAPRRGQHRDLRRSSATCCCWRRAFFANDLARFGGFAIALGGFGYSIYLTYLELFMIEAICQWCVASAVLMTILFLLNATRLVGYVGTERGGGRGKGNRRRRMSDRREREKRREERLQDEAKVDAGERRTRLLQTRRRGRLPGDRRRRRADRRQRQQRQRRRRRELWRSRSRSMPLTGHPAAGHGARRPAKPRSNWSSSATCSARSARRSPRNSCRR